MKKLFITGGAGFIGSALVRIALADLPECSITNFDALTYAGNLDNLQGLDPRRHRFIHGDITDRQAVLAALEPGTDAILHCAAESHVDRSIVSANTFLHTNVLGVQVLLDAARERQIGRFVQVSTDEVLGSLPDHDSTLFTESFPLAPNNPYAASKASAEHLVRAAHHTFGLDTVITRCGNNYGPRQFPEKLIPLILANALRFATVPVYGDGKNVRDWIYVDDHCRGILSVLLRGRSGEIYHLGARNPLQNLQVVETLLTLLNRPLSLIRFIKDRPGHDRRYAMDASKIEQELGWRPRESWSSGLSRTMDWYKSNSVWLERARSGAYRAYYEQQYGADLGVKIAV